MASTATATSMATRRRRLIRRGIGTVPPPPAYLMEALDKWELFLHDRDRMADLIQCALVHEQFESLHPFPDGNGRLGRPLITLS